MVYSTIESVVKYVHVTTLTQIKCGSKCIAHRHGTHDHAKPTKSVYSILPPTNRPSMDNACVYYALWWLMALPAPHRYNNKIRPAFEGGVRSTLLAVAC